MAIAEGMEIEVVEGRPKDNHAHTLSGSTCRSCLAGWSRAVDPPCSRPCTACNCERYRVRAALSREPLTDTLPRATIGA